MRLVRLVLLILACVLFALSGFGVRHPKADLTGLGLTLCVIAALISL
jgi:hypothetical protein